MLRTGGLGLFFLFAITFSVVGQKHCNCRGDTNRILLNSDLDEFLSGLKHGTFITFSQDVVSGSFPEEESPSVDSIATRIGKPIIKVCPWPRRIGDPKGLPAIAFDVYGNCCVINTLPQDKEKTNTPNEDQVNTR